MTTTSRKGKAPEAVASLTKNMTPDQRRALAMELLGEKDFEQIAELRKRRHTKDLESAIDARVDTLVGESDGQAGVGTDSELTAQYSKARKALAAIVERARAVATEQVNHEEGSFEDPIFKVAAESK